MGIELRMSWIGTALVGLAVANIGWSQCTHRTDKLSVARSWLSGTSAGGFVLLAGGELGSGVISKKIDVYEACSGQWTSLDFPSGVSRHQGSATSVDGVAIFAGGNDGDSSSTVTDQVDLYDSTTGKPPTDPSAWSAAKLTERRRFLASTSVNGWGIVGGGLNGSGNETDAVDAYDSGTGSWSSGSVLPGGGRYHLAAASAGPYALFAGGQRNAAGMWIVSYYDSTTGLPPTNQAAWKTANILSVARYGLGAASVGTQALFVGGRLTNAGAIVDTVDIYDSAIGAPDFQAAWTTATLSIARQFPMVATAGQRVFIAGGATSGNGTPTDVVDVYDYATGTWSTARPSEARVFGGAAGACGHAVFGGGKWGTGVSNMSDAVDVFPDCDSWNYCEATPNSTGLPAYIGYTGSLGISANDFTLTASGCPPKKPCMFFYADSSQKKTFGNGYLCVGGPGSPLYRLGPPLKTSASGTASRLVDFTQAPACCGPSQITPGSTWYYQFYFRDAGGAGFDFTDGLRAVFFP